MDDELAKTSLIYRPLEVIKKKFKAQPIICSKTRDVVAAEILYKYNTSLLDNDAFLEIDRSAIEASAMLLDYYRWIKRKPIRVHCNVELSSFTNPSWMEVMVVHVTQGVVVEIVERHDHINDKIQFEKMVCVADWVRALGGQIALDDVSGTKMDEAIIKAVRPEMVKVCNKEALEFARNLSKKPKFIAEMIETEEHAHRATALGVHELQGYWCDVIKEHEFPSELTPPGVAFWKARNGNL